MKLEYGPAKECEYPTCERTRGASLRSLYHYGCVLCTFHGNELQKGNISLPGSATTARKREAEREILG